MAIVGVGVDVVDVQRFVQACDRTPGFLSRVLTSGEIEGRNANSLAARFAAKEAVAKALGAPAGMAWHDCVISNEANGRPCVELRGTVLAASQDLGIQAWHLSLSHDAGLATAFVVAVTN